jgi:succinate dehydrogenase/fumarate reductase flavoprotein subunit
MFTTDVLVIGSEGAGARAAWEIADRGLAVTCVTRARLGCCHPVTGGEPRVEPATPTGIVKDLVLASDWKGYHGADD